MIASGGFLEDELCQCSRRRSDDGRQCGNAWSRLENEGQEVGSERKSEKKKCKVRFSLIKKNKAFQKSYMKVGSRSCCERVWCQQERGECMQKGWLPRKG